MYEKLDRLREDLKRAERRKKVADEKLKLAQDRLKEAENEQILFDVGALNLTPEQVGQFLRMAASGQLGTAVNAVGDIAEAAVEAKEEGQAAADPEKEETTNEEDEDGEEESDDV